MQKWQIVLATTMVVGLMVAGIWLIQGFTEAQIRIAIRATARSSCLLFLAAFIASALKRVWTTPFSIWLLQNRRFFGISMAVSHTYHAISLAALYWVTAGAAPKIEPLAILGYVFLYAMALTSFKSTADLIGRRAWRILHTAGMHFFWLAFTLEFGTRMMKDWIYLLLTTMLIAALLLRLIALKGQSKKVLANESKAA